MRIFGILGPHPAQIADGYSWFGWLVPRFTAAVVDAIIADLDTIAEACPPGQVDVVHRRDDTVEIITAAHTAAEHVDQVHADADGIFTLGAYRWCWESADPDPTAPSGHASTPPTGRPVCLCPRRCVLCGEPLAGHHDLDCGWSHGSREGESPHLAREPLVLSRHIHQPGCRHAQRHPGGLFEQINAHGDVWCLICAAINTLDRQVVPSYGGTTEYHHRCTACGAGWGFCDLSAIR